MVGVRDPAGSLNKIKLILPGVPWRTFFFFLKKTYFIEVLLIYAV